jgi:hypothetical protein
MVYTAPPELVIDQVLTVDEINELFSNDSENWDLFTTEHNADGTHNTPRIARAACQVAWNGGSSYTLHWQWGVSSLDTTFDGRNTGEVRVNFASAFGTPNEYGVLVTTLDPLLHGAGNCDLSGSYVKVHLHDPSGADSYYGNRREGSFALVAFGKAN